MDGLTPGAEGGSVAASQSTTQTPAGAGVSSANPAVPDTGAPGSAAQEPAGSQQTQQNPSQQPGTTPAQDDTRLAAARRAGVEEAQTRFQKTTELIKNYGAANECYSDSDVESKFGSQGIHTLEDLAREVDRRQAAERIGVDPNALQEVFRQMKESDPDFQALRAQAAKVQSDTQISVLQEAFPGLQIDRSKPDLGLPNAKAIAARVRAGQSLKDAYILSNLDSIIKSQTTAAQQQTISNIIANGQSSPGSLAGGEGSPEKSVWDLSEKDFRSMQERALRGELSKK